jgi:hypothetical protein
LLHRRAAWASLRKGGVGGTRLGSAPTVKCLHLQVVRGSVSVSIRERRGSASVFPP